MTEPIVEKHPLKPFLPANARVLFLGSFPPPKSRWCMDFFYPNPQNDMWRIMGLVFFGDKLHFVNEDKKFKYNEIVAFCEQKRLAFYDTASAIRRLRGNASDEFLEVVEQTDIAKLLEKIPFCHDICCTGQKSLDTLAQNYSCEKPKTGCFIETNISGRPIRLWRMPSTSRAFPLAIDKKAGLYYDMLNNIQPPLC